MTLPKYFLSNTNTKRGNVMLLLCSNGLSSDSLRKAVHHELEEAKKAALVVTADHEYKEQNYHVSRCVYELESLNLSVEIFDLDVQPAHQLLNYDVVEFIGGNPYYLLHRIRIHNAESILRKIALEKVLIGWSAAAFVFGPTLELVNCYSPEMNFLHLTDLSALALTEIQVLPHYRKFSERFPDLEKICREYELLHNVAVVRLDDGDGIFTDQQKTVIIREQREGQ